MDKYERDREGLIKKLLESVKQCQVDFGGKSILASEKDSSVSCLVAQFEQAFQHGLKKNKMWEMISSYVEPVRQITDKMLLEIDLTFWSVVKEYLGTSELNYFNTLPDITTDSGKARVWLRTAINETTLERQLLLILGNVALLKQFYEPWALFIDGERSSIIPVMARGLASIVFAIDVKNSSLNRPFKQISVPNGSTKSEKVASKTHRRVNSSPMLQQCIAEPSIMKKINMKKKKKKRAVSAEITDLDDGSNLYSDSSRTESSSYTENTYCSYITANMLSKNKSSTNQIQTHRRKASAPNSQTIFNTSQFEDLKNFSIKDSHLINSENIIDNKENNVRSCIQKKGCNVELKTETKEMVQTLCTKNSFEQKDKIGNLKDSNNSEETRPRTGDVVSDDILNVKEFELKVGYEDNENYTKGSFVPENDDVFEKNFQVSLTRLNSGEKQPGKKHYQLENLEKYEVDNERKISIENQEQKSLVTKNFYGKNTENVSFEIKSSPECIESFIPYDEISTRAASDMLPLLVCSNIDKVFPVYQLPEEEKNLKGFGELLTKEFPQNAPESLSIDDLKQAVLATVKKKDDVEQKNLDLQRALDEERNINRCLKNDLECATIKIREKEDTIEKKLTETLQENEILKNQLKKYVAAVKMLKKENGFTIDFIDGYEVVDVSTNNKNDTYDTYEEKLSQMAELHGELMEFQEHLQKQLISQDNQISRMKQELVSLRGPLPIDLLPSSTSAYFFIKNYFTPNRLVSILVPSVFLKRKGTESHHLYQVYTRIGEEEWNVYRRYSQFNKLRTHVSKMNLKTLEKFDFPKKNVFGKKDTKFLEERRLRLQEYLRTVINACISAHLSIDNSKQDLINHIPFFGENFCDDNQNKL
ncbi:sorting nexin-29 isoform X2 [Hydra vulgaris]|uniref:sorting nexin-29 isoform X2 n=1 Tax=Hydra vulgaris TaxID=6087 RepID=UPI001F5FC935|nr:sorting nexin-29 isoform X2 [Hydra vulgaris]